MRILPNLSQFFEYWIHNQSKNLENGLRKGLSTQHYLLPMIEKLRKSVESGGVAVALSTDLWKVLDCLAHQVLIAKLHAYGIREESLNFLYFWLKIENKGFVWIALITNGRTFYSIYRNYSHVISFYSFMTFLLQNIQMKTPHILLV